MGGGGKTQNLKVKKVNQIQTISKKLKELASVIRNNPQAREEIAQGFEVIAEAMEPCVDCNAEKPVAAGESTQAAM